MYLEQQKKMSVNELEGGATGNQNPFYIIHWLERCYVKHTDGLVQEYHLHLSIRRFQYGSYKNKQTN
jgi:hypothetical protein